MFYENCLGLGPVGAQYIFKWVCFYILSPWCFYVSCLQTTEPDGKKIRRVIFQHPGSDVTGMLACSEKVAGACEQVTVDGSVFKKSKRLLSFIRQQSQTERRYVG